MTEPSRKPILIVEDDPDIREALVQFLEEDEGLRVVSVANGDEALKLLSVMERPCMILLDVLMPVLDGHGFLKRLNLLHPHLSDLPVVIMSASDQHTMGLPFVAKPFAFEELLAMVRQHCGSGQEGTGELRAS